jgi:hypothetical protein
MLPVVYFVLLLFLSPSASVDFHHRDHVNFHYFAIELVSPDGADYATRATAIADQFNYELVGQVGEIEELYLFRTPKKQRGKKEDHATIMKRHSRSPDIKSSHYQLPRKRFKRAMIDEKRDRTIKKPYFEDPLYPSQWHLVRSPV